MRPVTISQTGAGSTNPIPMDMYGNPFSVSLGVTVSGTVNYTVQHTFDDVFATSYLPASGNWYNHVSLAAQTGQLDGNYAYPVTAIRLTQNSGSGTTTLRIHQSGGTGGA